MSTAVTGGPIMLLAALCGIVLGFVFLETLPMTEMHPLFLAALPLMCAVALGVVLEPTFIVALLIFTRALLDPLLEMTRSGSFGFGAVLNLAVVLTTVWLLFKNPPPLLKSSFFGSWLWFLFICGIASLFSPYTMKGVKLLFNFSSYLCMALLPSLVRPYRNDKKFWVKLLLSASVLPVLIGNFNLIRGGGHVDALAGSRLLGTFSHPNILGFYLVWVLSMILYVWKSGVLRLTGWQKFALFVYFMNVLVLLFATKTRNAWIGAWLMFLIYGLLKDKRMLVACLAMAVAGVTLPPLLARFGDLFQPGGRQLNSFAWRMEVWKLSMPSIRENWALGHGLASYRELSYSFLSVNPLITIRRGIDAHNVYLQLWFEAGVLGVLAYLAIYWQMIKAFYRRVKWSVKGLSEEYAVALSYLLVYMINGIADNMIYYLALNWYCWFFWGVLLKAMRFQRFAWVGSRARAQASAVKAA